MMTFDDRGIGNYAYEMKAPDGTVVHRVPLLRSGYVVVRWKGYYRPVYGGIRGPLFIGRSKYGRSS